MELDLSGQPEIVQRIAGYAVQGYEIALTWLTSPAAWSQFAILLAAYILAVLVNRRLTPFLTRLLTPDPEKQNIIATSRRFLLIFLPLILPILAYGFTAIGEQVTRSVFGSGAVIAFGKRVFLFIAARAFARDILKDPFLKLLGKFFLVPAAALYALGLLPLVAARLEATLIPLGNLSFNLLWLIQFAIVGGVIFWFGQWSNSQSKTYIVTQEEMRPATRQLAAKAAEVAIFGVAFLVLMNIMGVSLTSLAVIGGAVGVGLGFGLQQIASNFISGVILLLEGEVTVGDYVELDGGEAGTIVKMMARATILETFDGRWITVPNEHFITTRVTNFSDSGSANRYEAAFSVSYDTDVTQVPAIIEAAVAKCDFVLSEPEGPGCDLMAFGDSGIDFAVEFWVNGIDDGKNKYVSDVLMVVWIALKDADIEIPFPHRVVEIKGALPNGAHPA
ncbi:mechanosensitive ion channel family protein [Actibacterium sp. 188UL27-1]|uniref:mechanosensitive ion channel family protein n=1 Tax=Actibacterium sp. 188UL27-1 TaxID=2786961 RepID=UPI001959D8F0|nr:mechanosensitive ion channel domain-containing protein [Actibacterium sp. 188UL27-1]MBM7067169.1 mechanosensitive ion channel [Actibacterium sp. 188UL27-1]